MVRREVVESIRPGAKRTRCLLLLLTFFCAGYPRILAAQGEPEPGSTGREAPPQDVVQSYERAFFDRFNPQTARDLIDRLPGFTLDTGADDLRGFGGAAGNVLFDGERPSSKAGGIEDALRRTPANQVERIDVIRGTAGLSETAGQAVVANIIRREVLAPGSYEVKIERPADGILYPSGELALPRRLANWTTFTKINAFWERFPLEGTRVQSDADGELISAQQEDRPSVLTQVYLSSEAKRPVAGGTLTLTARTGRSAFLPDTERLGYDGRLPDGDPDERFSIDFDSTLVEGELGIDWSRLLATGWSLKLLSLSSLRSSEDEQDTFNESPIGNAVSGSTFDLSEDRFETILRVAFSRATASALKPEFGAEITHNRLDSDLTLETFVGDEVTTIDLPAADVIVEETRAEVFASLVWQAAARVSLEGGLAFETSDISVTGDATNSQRFSFLKPFATIIYDWRPGIQLRAGARRTVGQLSFSEFAASASAEDDRLLAGNPSLGPDQTTRGTFTIDLRSDSRGALNVEFFHEWRGDVIEQVELPGGFGASNAGDGRVWGVTTNASVPLAPFIEGGLLEIEADVRDSTFTDPLTGASRQLSNVSSPSLFAEFRQDLTRYDFSWGFSYRAEAESAVFFANEESFEADGETLRVFAETTRYLGLRLNLALRNIGGRDFLRERRFFSPSRAGQFNGTEVIDRERGIFATLTVAGQF